VKFLKRLPIHFETQLNATLFALWYLDDSGTLYGVKDGRGAVLDIPSYRDSEGDRIQAALVDTFGLDSTLQQYPPTHTDTTPGRKVRAQLCLV
jgi:hypothetical protein